MTALAQLRQLSPMARRLVAMKFLSYVGLMGSYFIGIMGTLTYTAGGNEWWSSWCVGIINFAQVMGNMASGHIVDALGPRRHFAITVGALVAGSVAFLPLSASVGGIMVGAALVGFAWGISGSVMQAYPAYLSADLDELKTINAALNTAVSVGVIVGPLAGSAISLVAPSQYVLLLTAVSALIALIPAAGFYPLRDPRKGQVASNNQVSASEQDDKGDAPVSALHATQDTAPSTSASDQPVSQVGHTDAKKPKSAALEGFRVVASSPTLRLLLVSGFMAFFAYGAFDPLEALYYRDVLHAGVEWMGVLSSAAGAGALVGGLALLHLPKRHVNMRTFLLMLMVEGLGCVLYTATDNVAIALAGQLVLGAANGAFMPLQNTLIQVHAPLESVGRVTAAIGLGYTCSGVIPLLLAPALASAFGVQTVLVGAGLCVAAFPLAVQVILRKRLADSVAEERALAEGEDAGAR